MMVVRGIPMRGQECDVIPSLGGPFGIPRIMTNSML